jgi:phosphate starvation-inducible PhoH-like protein
VKADDIARIRLRFHETGKTIIPRTVNQAAYVSSIFNNPVTFGIGPAGTGKTFLAVAAAVQMFNRGETEKIILTRPAVEAGESLGYLPGDFMQKINPYLRPLYDALFELQPQHKIAQLIERGSIEIAPLAYMRGRTLNNAIVILDEGQNTTIAQMKMFLTRLGRGSRIIVSGDVTQIDLQKNSHSGLLDAKKILHGIPGISFIRFDKGDISRHPVVEKIVEAYEGVAAKQVKHT